MTYDIVALLGDRPEHRMVSEIIAAASQQPSEVLEVSGTTRVYDGSGRLMISIEEPLLVPIAGEAERLLGRDVAGLEPPVWWVELRAAAGVPGADVLARRVADGLAGRMRGRVWPAAPGGGMSSGAMDGAMDGGAPAGAAGPAGREGGRA